jgi:hypothetical protein
MFFKFRLFNFYLPHRGQDWLPLLTDSFVAIKSGRFDDHEVVFHQSKATSMIALWLWLSFSRLSSSREFPEGFKFNETEALWNSKVSSEDILVGSICSNAATWLDPPVPYNQQAWYNGYRTDCSGYVNGLGLGIFVCDLDPPSGFSSNRQR